jgi:hypothetical protein
MPWTMMYLASFVVSAIIHRSTLCWCDLSRYTIQERHLRISLDTLDHSRARYPTIGYEPSRLNGHHRSIPPLSFVEWRSTLSWSSVSTKEEITLHPAVFLTVAAGRHQDSVRDYDNGRLRFKIRLVQDEFDDNHNHYGQWHVLCTMGNRDGPTSQTEACV